MSIPPFRKLGQTGLRVSPIGLGLAALGRPGYINLGHAEDIGIDHDIDIMQAQANRVMDAALKHGVRYFDAARSYGLAEAYLSYWLKQHSLAPGDVTIGSKWGYTYTAGWQSEAKVHEVKEHSLANLNKQWLETEGLLAEHLNLYQIHSVTLESDVLGNDRVLGRLGEFRAQGCHIGLSVSGADQARVIEKALRIDVNGERLFSTVQATYNLLEPSAAGALALAHSEGLGILIKEALANGRLTERNEVLSFTPKMDVLRKQSWRAGVGIDALAIAYVLAKPWVDVVLSGAATVEQIVSNADALDVTLDEAALYTLSQLSETPDVYWQTRAELPWN